MRFDIPLAAKDILTFLQQEGYACSSEKPLTANVYGFCPLNNLKDNCITWIKNGVQVSPGLFAQKKNVLLIAGPEMDVPESVSVIACANPKAAFFSVLKHFFQEKNPAQISPNAVVEAESIGANVSIGHFSYVCAGSVIEDDVVIEHNVTINCPTHIGKGSVIGSGTVIGTDGYGYYKDTNGIQQRVPHFGGVTIGKYVEIGACVCIDRGTMSDTIIEDHVKIDNLCHIGHNAHIEKHAMVIAMSMLAGSSTVRENAYLAPGVMIMNQKTVGKNSLVGMGAVVVKDVPEGKVVAGVPAKILRDND